MTSRQFYKATLFPGIDLRCRVGRVPLCAQRLRRAFI